MPPTTPEQDDRETPFRIYAVFGAGAPQGSGIPAFLGAADDVSLGEALLDLHRRGRLDGARVGIMYRPEHPGEWLVNPYVR